MRYKIKQQAFSIGFLPVNNDYLIYGFLTSLHVAMLLRQASTSSSPSSPPSLQVTRLPIYLCDSLSLKPQQQSMLCAQMK
ncbi:hypothetical protein ACE6H2_009121 [Prunus campanulata]